VARLDTKLESEAAEFLALGYLLLEGISAFKAYTNFHSYDLIAADASNNTSARIQVKSRYRTNYDGFIIKNLDCDFVVLVTLNRGYSNGTRRNGDTGILPPEFFVMPFDYIKQVRDPNNHWGKITKSRLVNIKTYKNRWTIIKEFLENNNKVIT
jgi:hypothetical protein